MMILLSITELFKAGGPVMMTLILLCLLLALFFLIMGYVNLNKKNGQTEKMISLSGHISLLGLVLGFFGAILGLVSVFDQAEMMGDLAPHVFAAGLKMSFLTTLFGALVFCIARAGILVLKWLQKVPESE